MGSQSPRQLHLSRHQLETGSESVRSSSPLLRLILRARTDAHRIASQASLQSSSIDSRHRSTHNMASASSTPSSSSLQLIPGAAGVAADSSSARRVQTLPVLHAAAGANPALPSSTRQAAAADSSPAFPPLTPACFTEDGLVLVREPVLRALTGFAAASRC
jgi:hypothetical protein